MTVETKHRTYRPHDMRFLYHDLGPHAISLSFFLSRILLALFAFFPVYQSDDFVQAQTPGSRDVLVFERKPSQAGKSGGIVHFGFRLRRPEDIERARTAIRDAGGTIKETGEFVPGEPYVFFSDPDGFEVEKYQPDPDPARSETVTTSRPSGRPPRRNCRLRTGCSRYRSIRRARPAASARTSARS